MEQEAFHQYLEDLNILPQLEEAIGTLVSEESDGSLSVPENPLQHIIAKVRLRELQNVFVSDKEWFDSLIHRTLPLDAADPAVAAVQVLFGGKADDASVQKIRETGIALHGRTTFPVYGLDHLLCTAPRSAIKVARQRFQAIEMFFATGRKLLSTGRRKAARDALEASATNRNHRWTSVALPPFFANVYFHSNVTEVIMEQFVTIAVFHASFETAMHEYCRQVLDDCRAAEASKYGHCMSITLGVTPLKETSQDETMWTMRKINDSEEEFLEALKAVTLRKGRVSVKFLLAVHEKTSVFQSFEVAIVETTPISQDYEREEADDDHTRDLVQLTREYTLHYLALGDGDVSSDSQQGPKPKVTKAVSFSEQPMKSLYKGVFLDASSAAAYLHVESVSLADAGAKQAAAMSKLKKTSHKAKPKPSASLREPFLVAEISLMKEVVEHANNGDLFGVYASLLPLCLRYRHFRAATDVIRVCRGQCGAFQGLYTQASIVAHLLHHLISVVAEGDLSKKTRSLETVLQGAFARWHARLQDASEHSYFEAVATRFRSRLESITSDVHGQEEEPRRLKLMNLPQERQEIKQWSRHAKTVYDELAILREMLGTIHRSLALDGVRLCQRVDIDNFVQAHRKHERVIDTEGHRHVFQTLLLSAGGAARVLRLERHETSSNFQEGLSGAGMVRAARATLADLPDAFGRRVEEPAAQDNASPNKNSGSALNLLRKVTASSGVPEAFLSERGLGAKSLYPVDSELEQEKLSFQGLANLEGLFAAATPSMLVREATKMRYLVDQDVDVEVVSAVLDAFYARCNKPYTLMIQSLCARSVRRVLNVDAAERSRHRLGLSYRSLVQDLQAAQPTATLLRTGLLQNFDAATAKPALASKRLFVKSTNLVGGWAATFGVDVNAIESIWPQLPETLRSAQSLRVDSGAEYTLNCAVGCDVSNIFCRALRVATLPTLKFRWFLRLLQIRGGHVREHRLPTTFADALITLTTELHRKSACVFCIAYGNDAAEFGRASHRIPMRRLQLDGERDRLRLILAKHWDDNPCIHMLHWIMDDRRRAKALVPMVLHVVLEYLPGLVDGTHVAKPDMVRDIIYDTVFPSLEDAEAAFRFAGVTGSSFAAQDGLVNSSSPIEPIDGETAVIFQGAREYDDGWIRSFTSYRGSKLSKVSTLLHDGYWLDAARCAIRILLARLASQATTPVLVGSPSARFEAGWPYAEIALEMDREAIEALIECDCISEPDSWTARTALANTSVLAAAVVQKLVTNGESSQVKSLSLGSFGTSNET